MLITCPLTSLQLFNYFQQILAVLVLYHGLGQLAHPFFVNPTLAVRDAFEAGDFQALAFFQYFDVGTGLAE